MSVITNLVTDPNCLKNHQVWQCTGVKSGSHYRYEPTANAYQYTVSAFGPSLANGTYVAVLEADQIPNTITIGLGSASSGTQLSRSSTRIVFRVPVSNPKDSQILLWSVAAIEFTPLRTAVYTQDDWTRLQAVNVNWFDGDTMPLN